LWQSVILINCFNSDADTLFDFWWLFGRKHCVYGQVTDGYSVVKAMEALGSRAGDTAQDIMISDCGEIKASVEGAANTGRRASAPRQPSPVEVLHCQASLRILLVFY
jgi:cyclophilin family peptidyl-prolyl cis-trans isomerase